MAERQALSECDVKRLYVRYFDVVAGGDGYRPAATVIFKDSLPGMEVVPVVFVVNDVLKPLAEDSVAALARKICARIEDINRKYHVGNIPEIQIDCDWNGTTREKYFRLLRHIRHHPLLSGRQLSVTLRLYQWKYRKTAGIPPADRVCLMCYNMGNFTSYHTRNSIFDADEAAAYLRFSVAYPAPADVALPLFGWGVRFNHFRYAGLINGLSEKDLQTPEFSVIRPGVYRADTSVSLLGVRVRKGEHIRLEEPDAEAIRQTAEMLAKRVKNHGYLVWFHLDSSFLHKFTSHEMAKIADMFH
jgi:hypothetical protein